MINGNMSCLIKVSNLFGFLLYVQFPSFSNTMGTFMYPYKTKKHVLYINA